MTSPRRVRAEYLLLAFLTSLFLFRSFLPAWQSLNTDFRNYYIAARLYREGTSLLRVYDFTWFERQKDHFGMEQGLVGFVPDTLLSALPIVPFAELPPLAAKRYWLVINAVFLALGALILSRMTQLGWRRVLIVIFLCVEPLSRSFLYGQMHLFVFLLLAIAVWCSERERPATAGIAVALAAGLKLYPVLFLAFFIRKKQWRAAAGMVAALGALAGLSIYLFGWQVHSIYLREILPPAGRGETLDPYAPLWNSLTALLHRALIAEPQLNPHPLIHAPALYALVQPLCQAAIFVAAVWLLVPGAASRTGRRLEWAAFIAMLMALSTGPLRYHLTVLILSAVLGLDALLAEGRRRAACALAAVYALVCLPWTDWLAGNAGGWRMFPASPRLYPLLALPLLLYGIIWRSPGGRARLACNRRESWVFAGIFACLAAMGILAAFHHGRGEFNNYSHRIFTLRGSPLQGEPAVSASGLYFTRMPGRSPSFETWRWSEGQFTPLPPAEDEFHPASAPDLAEVWVERAGPVSNIVRFSNLAGVPNAKLEVSNGEQPSVSADGKWLAFVRENRGRGALWIKALAPGVPGSPQVERSLVDDAYDVWEAAFASDDRMVFTAAPQGQPRLYSVDLASGHVTPLPITGPARYPAVAPDGHGLAYSRSEHGAWQLYVANLAAGSTRRLTDSDCNSISPVWEQGGKSLIYSTDCGRGVGMTALARVVISP